MRELLLGVALADQVLDCRRRRPSACPFRARLDDGDVVRVAGSPASPSRSRATLRTSTRRSSIPAGLLRRKLRAARFVVTCTEANRRHLQAIGDGADVHRVYHGLNVDFARLLATAARTPCAGTGRLRVLAVGRLVAKKGFDVLVEACGILAGAACRSRR